MKLMFFICLCVILFYENCVFNPTCRAPRPTAALREIADSLDFQIGVAFDGWQFHNEKWQKIVAREFNQATIHWGIYWPGIEPEQGTFDFRVADMQIRFARENHMVIRGHPLVFPEYTPDWMVQGHFSDEELLTILQKHITQIVTRYKGIVHQWVVVNEAYLHPYRRADIFYERFGYDYITYAFQAARAADPSAILLYNDTDNHLPDSPTTALSFQIVTQLRSRNLIDGVGLNMHLSADDPPDKNAVIQTLRNYGVPVYITEFDVDLRAIGDAPGKKYGQQAQIYREMFEAAVASGVCKNFSVWGIGDRYSWLEWPVNPPFTSPLADPTPYGDDLSPKPAYNALKAGLSSISLPTR